MRDLEVDEDEDEIEANIHVLRNNSGYSGMDRFWFRVFYRVNETTIRPFGFYKTDAAVAMIRYNRMDEWASTTYAGGDLTEEIWVHMTLDENSLSWEIYNSSHILVNEYETYDINVIPSSCLYLTLYQDCEMTHPQGRSQVFWVEAPFVSFKGLREWDETNLSATSDNPYYIKNEGGFNYENASVKVMPFQGFKALWNWTDPQACECYVIFTWYDRAGNYIGEVMFAVDTSSQTIGIYGRTNPTGGWTQLALTTALINEGKAIALWVEKSGMVYAYMQDHPESHTYGDFWVVDVTPYTDLDSWGVKITHDNWGQSNFESQLKEVEIFYGKKEGISQPRFGGMWWDSNILTQIFIWLALALQAVGAWIVAGLTPIINAVQTALAPVIIGVQTALAPLIIATTNAVDGLITYLSDIITNTAGILADTADIGNIWGVITSIVVDMMVEFVNEGVAPLWAHFVSNIISPLWQWFIDNVISPFWMWVGNNIITTIIVNLWIVEAVINSILEPLGTILFNDSNLLKDAFWAFVDFSFNFIYQMAYVIVDIPDVLQLLTQVFTGSEVLSMDLTNPLSFMSAIIYYVVTFAPIVVLLHLLISTMRSVQAMDIDPLIQCGLVYVQITMYIVTVIKFLLEFVGGVINNILELIPF